MAALKDLLRDLKRAIAEGKEDNVNAVRWAIAEHHPETPEGAEARYKLGLAALFRDQDLDTAAILFRDTAKAKQRKWSHCARTSLGLVLLKQGKEQQAIFELRRAASPRPPNLMVAQAAGLLVLALSELGNTKEAARARQQLIEILGLLLKHEDERVVAMASYMRGMEHKFDGEREPAKAMITKAVESGKLPPDELAAAQAVLEGL